ncbi:MAG TPA: HPF/RaiA family ribosome-associated protein [Candidatus Acidoferrum sp.]|nr:HPF/RaiA family ribosome-associated protein [Candidatus Acidoferrum sp.]
MQTQISYRNMLPSGALERLIRNEAEKLRRFFDHIVACRVLIEQAHKRQRQGAPFHVRIELSVPGDQLVVSHRADARPLPPLSDEGRTRLRGTGGEQEAEHKDAGLAIRDAFDKLERQLQDYATRKTAKTHDSLITR